MEEGRSSGSTSSGWRQEEEMMEEQVTTQDTEMATEESRIETAVEETPRRRRRGRKRTKFQVPKRFPLPVRALWQLASEEERKRAHQTCTAILEHWLGKASKKEVARTLSLPPLRVWQLSQQALSGMLAGLLVQPRVRGRLSAMPKPDEPESDPKVLRKKIRQLEEELRVAQELIDLLKHFPENQGRELPVRKRRKKKTTTGPEGGKRGGRTVRSPDPSGGGSVARDERKARGQKEDGETPRSE
jgi:hypothetical protein